MMEYNLKNHFSEKELEQINKQLENIWTPKQHEAFDIENEKHLEMVRELYREKGTKSITIKTRDGKTKTILV